MKSTSQDRIKPEIFVNFRPEPNPKSPGRLTTLKYNELKVKFAHPGFSSIWYRLRLALIFKFGHLGSVLFFQTDEQKLKDSTVQKNF